MSTQLRSHDQACPQRVGAECECGAFDHNEAVYAAAEPTRRPWAANGLKDTSDPAMRLACAIWTAEGDIPICSSRFQVGKYKAQSAEVQDANLRFIVKAVNAHEKMVSFVEYVRKFYQDNFDVMPVAFQTVDSEAESLLAEVQDGD